MGTFFTVEKSDEEKGYSPRNLWSTRPSSCRSRGFLWKPKRERKV